MRELRYRVWTGKKFIVNDGGEYEYFVSCEPFGEVRVIRRFLGKKDGVEKGWIIQEFTGMMDVSGNRIYEGDSIAYCWKPFRGGNPQIRSAFVKYDSQRAMFTVEGVSLSDNAISNIQVNGTIFDVDNFPK